MSKAAAATKAKKKIKRVVTDGALYLVDGERIRVLGAADPK